MSQLPFKMPKFFKYYAKIVVKNIVLLNAILYGKICLWNWLQTNQCSIHLLKIYKLRIKKYFFCCKYFKTLRSLEIYQRKILPTFYPLYITRIPSRSFIEDCLTKFKHFCHVLCLLTKVKSFPDIYNKVVLLIRRSKAGLSNRCIFVLA